MIAIIKTIDRLIKEEKGQGLVEYALILILVSLVAILAMSSFGGGTSDLYNDIVGMFS